MTSLRTCVVGVGRLGAEHARILSSLPGSDLIGIYDTDADRMAAVAEQASATAWTDLDRLLEASDAAVIAVPTADHARVAMRALEAGCHVLVEKPMAPSLEEADSMIRCAKRTGGVLAVGHVERFNPVFRQGEEYIRDPRFVQSLRLAPFGPRGTDVTVVLDLMIHDIDLVLGLVRREVVQMHAVGVPVLTDSVDIANARLVFEGGAVADITASRVSLARKRELRIFQPSGYVSLDLAAGSGEIHRLREPLDGATTPTGIEDVVERVALRGDGAEPLALELDAFLVAARGDGPPLVTAGEGRAALEVALRITRQIEEFADGVAQDT